MTTHDLSSFEGLDCLVPADSPREIRRVYCCDLLSLAMARAPADCAGVTVMGNMNTVAVASLAEVACIVLAEGAAIPEECLNKAREEGIPVYRTDAPVFETAKGIDQRI